MTFEFENILKTALLNQKAGLMNVLATVVALEGSSYRKPGVRMLVCENGNMTGAVSGGCVEQEILQQSSNVFRTNKACMMTYDGRYRLGCEGILYILLEPFHVTEELFLNLKNHIAKRDSFKITSCFSKDINSGKHLGSMMRLGNKEFFFCKNYFKPEGKAENFVQTMKPLFRLYIFGTEHDAVKLCSAAMLLGWEVIIVASPKDTRMPENFPDATVVKHLFPEEVNMLDLDNETAVLVMNHNFSRDLNILLALQDKKPAYLGLLGAQKRREKILDKLIELQPEKGIQFLENIHGPAGLDIGAITPQEIAVSILAEILATCRQKNAQMLKDKTQAVHT